MKTLTKILIGLLSIELLFIASVTYFFSQPEEVNLGHPYDTVEAIVVEVKKAPDSEVKSDILKLVIDALEDGIFTRWEYHQISVRYIDFQRAQHVDAQINKINQMLAKRDVKLEFSDNK